MTESTNLNNKPKRRIVQKINIFPAKDAPATGKGLLAYVHTIVNNMSLPSAKVVRGANGSLAVYVANTKGKDDTYRDNYGFASQLEEQDWKDDIIDQFELDAAKS